MPNYSQSARSARLRAVGELEAKMRDDGGTWAKDTRRWPRPLGLGALEPEGDTGTAPAVVPIEAVLMTAAPIVPIIVPPFFTG